MDTGNCILPPIIKIDTLFDPGSFVVRRLEHLSFEGATNVVVVRDLCGLE
jgi:hypothetical protein